MTVTVMQLRIGGCLTEAEKQCQLCGHFSQCGKDWREYILYKSCGGILQALSYR